MKATWLHGAIFRVDVCYENVMMSLKLLMEELEGD